MSFLPYIIVIVFGLLLLKNRVWAFSFYLSCRLLLPPIVRMGTISMNSVMSFMMVAYLLLNIKSLINKEYKLLFPITSFLLPLAILSIGGIMPMEAVLKNVLQTFWTEISPAIFMALIVKTSRDIKLILKTILIAYCIVGVWGVITYIMKMNILYTFFIAQYAGNYDVHDETGDGTEVIRGALDSVTTGNLAGPLPWGQESLLLMLFFLFIKHKEQLSKKLIFFVIILAGINIFLSGKRSCLLPMLLASSYYLWYKGIVSVKNILLSLVVCVSTYMVVSSIPQLDSFKQNIETTLFFWDDALAEKNNVSGSNMDMRKRQFEYANMMISNHMFTGLGYDYPGYYTSLHGNHPVMLGFESICFVIIVSSGIIGLYSWFFFFRRLCLLSYKSKDDLKFIVVYHGAFLLSCILTAIQSSLWIYLILSYLYIKENILYNSEFKANMPNNFK